MFLSASSRKKTPLMKYVKRTPVLAANCRVAFQNSTSFEPSNASSTNCGGVGTLAMNYLPDGVGVQALERTLPLRPAQHSYSSNPSERPGNLVDAHALVPRFSRPDRDRCCATGTASVMTEFRPYPLRLLSASSRCKMVI